MADKPLVIDPNKFTVLQSVLSKAADTGTLLLDIMTERYEITSILQREIVNAKDVFGDVLEGTADEPSVVKSSTHHLSKKVAGKQLKRPWWFFDTDVQGEGLVDITTHLVDLVFWILYPEKPINYLTDIEMIAASR